MAAPCKLCIHPDQQAIERAFNDGFSDRAIGAMFKVSHMAAFRHRTAHIVKPARDRLAIISKAADAREEREQLAVAAASESPSTRALVEATIGLRAQMAKLTSIEQRLERMATLAEGAGSPAGVAQLAAQQFRGIEAGARLAGIGGFAPVTHASGQPGEAARFSITMVFPNAGKVEEITISAPREAGSPTHLEIETERSEDNAGHREDRQTVLDGDVIPDES